MARSFSRCLPTFCFASSFICRRRWKRQVPFKSDTVEMCGSETHLPSHVSSIQWRRHVLSAQGVRRETAEL